MGYLEILVNRYPRLFRVLRDSKGMITKMYFSNTNITTDLLLVQQMDSGSITMRSVCDQMFTNIEVRLHFGGQRGHMHMREDQHLSDDICISLYAYGIIITTGEYYDQIKTYDQQAILRRHTINQIITHG